MGLERLGLIEVEEEEGHEESRTHVEDGTSGNVGNHDGMNQAVVPGGVNQDVVPGGVGGEARANML